MDKSAKKQARLRTGLSAMFNRQSSREPVIDGIRALAILWVLIVHVVFFHFGTFPNEVQRILNSGWTKWIGQGAYGVDMRQAEWFRRFSERPHKTGIGREAMAEQQ